MALGALGDGALIQGTGAPAASRPELNLAQVYAQHFRYVWRCLRSLGVREPSLDDALQDVFVVVQRRFPEFDGRAELRTWLYAIALRVGRKYRARAAREPQPLEDESERVEPIAPGDTERVAESKQRLRFARLALGSLDDDKREVFVLARIEQMSAPEIAAIIGIPLNTVYSRLRLARDAFDAAILRLESRKED
jgi:RNA polymerase sigma-70 factor (ECF subfamily)